MKETNYPAKKDKKKNEGNEEFRRVNINICSGTPRYEKLYSTNTLFWKHRDKFSIYLSPNE